MRNPRFRYLTALLPLLLGMLLASCAGGGTVSTGDSGSTRIQGIVENQQGLPLQALRVTVAETGDSTVTDEQGLFGISTTLPGDVASLLIETEEISGTAVIPDIPQGQSTVELQIQFHDESGLVLIESVTITPLAQATAAPTGSPGSAPPGNVTPAPQPEVPGEPEPQGRSIYRGSVAFSDGLPVPGALLTLLRTGAASTSGPDGNFAINTRSVHGTVLIGLRYAGLEGVVTLQNIPRGDIIVEMKLLLRISSMGVPTPLPAPPNGGRPTPGANPPIAIVAEQVTFQPLK